ncbi:hypothetical protein SESBI_25544 [Sesbania bispinosa]|nr:hypothetical protein SESBI_25544 [Sesbania bispinosa]
MRRSSWDISPYTQKQKLRSFFEKDEEVYPNPTRAFYATGSIEDFGKRTPLVKSSLKGQEIILDIELLSKLTGLKSEWIFLYNEKNWMEIVDVAEEEVGKALFVGGCYRGLQLMCLTGGAKLRPLIGIFCPAFSITTIAITRTVPAKEDVLLQPTFPLSNTQQASLLRRKNNGQHHRPSSQEVFNFASIVVHLLCVHCTIHMSMNGEDRTTMQIYITLGK